MSVLNWLVDKFVSSMRRQISPLLGDTKLNQFLKLVDEIVKEDVPYVRSACRAYTIHYIADCSLQVVGRYYKIARTACELEIA